MKKREPSCTVDGNVNWYCHYGEQCGSTVKKKRKIELWYNPAITLLSIHPEKTSSKKIHTPVFIVALFTIAKTKKQPKCPLIDE